MKHIVCNIKLNYWIHFTYQTYAHKSLEVQQRYHAMLIDATAGRLKHVYSVREWTRAGTYNGRINSYRRAKGPIEKRS